MRKGKLMDAGGGYEGDKHQAISCGISEFRRRRFSYYIVNQLFQVHLRPELRVPDLHSVFSIVCCDRLCYHDNKNSKHGLENEIIRNFTDVSSTCFIIRFALWTFKLDEIWDQKTLEKLSAERQAKIDELKERTNYYSTQQLIQKYDPDPAAKAAAASVIASKLGADSGLKVYLGDESQPNQYATSNNNEVEVHQTTGLRKRNQSTNPRNNPVQQSETEIGYGASERSSHGDHVVHHHDPATLGGQDGGYVLVI